MLAIVLAIATRQVYLSLAAGIWIGWTILSGWNPLAGAARAIDGAVAVLADDGNAKVILFTLVIGALIATLESAGGVRGFVEWLESRQWVGTPRRARLLAWLVGTFIFIESNITVLVAGAVSRPLFDRYRVSREKLAYLIDSTSAPVCILIPLNAWGAYILGILGTLGVVDSLEVFVSAIAFNFYAILAWLLAGVVRLYGAQPRRRHARAAERVHGGRPAPARLDASPGPRVARRAAESPVPPRASTMILPILTLIADDAAGPPDHRRRRLHRGLGSPPRCSGRCWRRWGWRGSSCCRGG